MRENPFVGKLSNKLIDHMTWYMCYQEGLRPPRYPVPVIPLNVEIHPLWQDDVFHNSITIYHEEELVCIWDFDFDRCMDFSYDVGVYVNGRRIEQGTHNYLQYLRRSHDA